jgi:hypothetical protein
MLDEDIAELLEAAAIPCIDALLEPGDRDTYREAMRLGGDLKCLKRTRAKIVDRMAQVETPAKSAPAPKARKRAR